MKAKFRKNPVRLQQLVILLKKLIKRFFYGKNNREGLG
jgi:hypothetical protein